MLDPAVTEPFTPIAPFMQARGFESGGPQRLLPPGAELPAIREAAGDVRAAILASGMPTAIRSCDLITLPYPTRFGLWRAAKTPSPYLWFTNRLFVVQWDDPDGRRCTLLWGPTDHERAQYTPYFDRLAQRNPLPERVMVTRHATVPDHLRDLGIDPADVDYLSFDHLHTQDVRRLIGTRGPAPDLGVFDRPVEPWLPNAKLIGQVREWESIRHLHPLQARWYQPETYNDLRPEGLLFIDGDVVLGPGVAILYTPGHTFGNQTLVLNSATGLWTFSENGVAAESWMPQASSIPGVRRWAAEWCQDVILNANTLELTAWQYNSMVAEALVADPTPDGDFRQTFPTSELRSTRRSPGTAPTYEHRNLYYGQLRTSERVRR
jgi:glyoxylase-like metal-dependent hydrolase (beta-lactamase superfamily II)